MSLLENAKKLGKTPRVRYIPSKEHAELVCAYFNGIISIEQFARVLKANRGNA